MNIVLRNTVLLFMLSGIVLLNRYPVAAQSLVQQMTVTPYDERYPAWSPDGSVILFETFQNGRWDIGMMDSEGANYTLLIDHDSNDRFPAFDPSGKYVVFQSDRTGDPELFIFSLETRETEQLTKSGAAGFFPSWSPDGKWIAFSSDRTGTHQIYMIHRQTGLLRQLTKGAYRSLWPRWSNDSKELVLFSRRDTNGEDDEIYTMELKDGSSVRLTRRNGHDFCPAWSPDNTRIAYVSVTGENRYIQIVDQSGKLLNRVGTSVAEPTEPSWSPDGTRIAYIAKTDGNYDIFVERVRVK